MAACLVLSFLGYVNVKKAGGTWNVKRELEGERPPLVSNSAGEIFVNRAASVNSLFDQLQAHEPVQLSGLFVDTAIRHQTVALRASSLRPSYSPEHALI
jgi:hypothetical protein